MACVLVELEEISEICLSRVDPPPETGEGGHAGPGANRAGR
jgi:hypothetical protein